MCWNWQSVTYATIEQSQKEDVQDQTLMLRSANIIKNIENKINDIWKTTGRTYSYQLISCKIRIDFTPSGNCKEWTFVSDIILNNISVL